MLQALEKMIAFQVLFVNYTKFFTTVGAGNQRVATQYKSN